MHTPSRWRSPFFFGPPRPPRSLFARTCGVAALLVLASVPLLPGPLSAKSEISLSSPVAKPGKQVDVYHGQKVKDPYRWLESLDAPETKNWVEAENKVTFDWLNRLPQREKLRARLTDLWNYEKYSSPTREGSRYFFSKNDGLQNQSVIYSTPTLTGAPAVLLDPNTLSKDGTVALGGLSISRDGKLAAYGLASAGSDWQEWHVREVETGKDLPDVVNWIKFSSAA